VLPDGTSFSPTFPEKKKKKEKEKNRENGKTPVRLVLIMVVSSYVEFGMLITFE